MGRIRDLVSLIETPLRSNSGTKIKAYSDNTVLRRLFDFRNRVPGHKQRPPTTYSAICYRYRV